MFRKRAKELKEQTVEDTSSIGSNEVALDEYTQHLKDMLVVGRYQYVLNKASQLGLADTVRTVLAYSRNHPIHLNLAEALDLAAHYGHIEVVDELIENDVNNKTYSVLSDYDSDSETTYTNER